MCCPGEFLSNYQGCLVSYISIVYSVLRRSSVAVLVWEAYFMRNTHCFCSMYFRLALCVYCISLVIVHYIAMAGPEVSIILLVILGSRTLTQIPWINPVVHFNGLI